LDGLLRNKTFLFFQAAPDSGKWLAPQRKMAAKPKSSSSAQKEARMTESDALVQHTQIQVILRPIFLLEFFLLSF
jgi:hypothetical protein